MRNGRIVQDKKPKDLLFTISGQNSYDIVSRLGFWNDGTITLLSSELVINEDDFLNTDVE